MMRIQVLFRISDRSHPKEKLPFSKLECLKNCIEVFGAECITVFADHCKPETLEQLHQMETALKMTESGNSGSWRQAALFALNGTEKGTAIYFVEDDYLHIEAAPQIIAEGLTMADYVTLYDHPDKYKTGTNPYIEQDGEIGRVRISASTHWKSTNSTTMTFATKVETLHEDWSVWQDYTSGPNPDDFGAFQRLTGIGSWENQIFGKKRTLISCIPGASTHTETNWLSPLVNWKQIGK